MIDWKIKLTPEATRFLAGLHPDTKSIIKSALQEIRESPHAGIDLQEELSGFKSFKPKRYRILYKLNEENQSIEVYYIGHRKDVYERFKRLLDRFE